LQSFFLTSKTTG